MYPSLPSQCILTTRQVWTINYRETAPAAANTTMFIANPNASRFGGLASAVPGEILGLETAHQMWGKLPWKRLVQPAAELAAGWEVDRELGRRLPVRPCTLYANLLLTSLAVVL